jgi:polysaccharide export outer membrane protein
MKIIACGRLALTITLAVLCVVYAAPRADAVSAPYVIGPEDVLEIQVWDNKDLNFGGFVRPDGKISLPLLGEVHAAGKTVQQFQDELTRLYEKTVKQPLVTVIVGTIKSRPVYFVGGFGRTGPLQLMTDMSLLEASSIVGIAPTGDAEKGYLLRGDRKIPVDFDKLLKKGDLSQNLKLETFDIVVIPVAEKVYLQGEVKGAGIIKYTEDLTLLKAITEAGGLTPMAAGGRIDILRTEGEKKVRFRVNLDKILEASDKNPDVKLKPDDIIFVPQRLF